MYRAKPQFTLLNTKPTPLGGVGFVFFYLLPVRTRSFSVVFLCFFAKSSLTNFPVLELRKTVFLLAIDVVKGLTQRPANTVGAIVITFAMGLR